MTAKHSSSRVIDLWMFLLTVFFVSLTAIFVIKYCALFDDLGLMAKQRLLQHPFATFVITPILFWISAYICRFYSPNASGNHLYPAIEKLRQDPNDFENVSNLLNIRLVMVKAISSLLTSFSGGALGKEGPSVHMAAGIFATLADRYKKFLPKISLESWVLSGTAAGLAIAFNAPIAGIIFVAEKLSEVKFKNFKNHLVWTLIIISIVTVIFYRPNPIFNFHNLAFTLRTEAALLITLAISCGFIALLFQTANSYFYFRIANIKSSWWHLAPIAAGIAIAYLNFYCGIYSFSGGIYTSQEALLSEAPILSYKEVGGRILNTVLTFASGCAGGLIAPAMAIGTGIGSIFSSLMPSIDIGIFLLIGMTSFLAAVLGEPITAAIVVFEATGQSVENIPFLIGAAIISSAVFKGLKKINLKKLLSILSK